MRLVEQIINKKLMKFDTEFMNNKNNFWDLYQVYNIASVFFPTKIDKERLNTLWQGVLKNDEESIKQMTALVYKHRKGVYACLTKVREEIDKQIVVGDLRKRGSVAVSDYEYQ